jgi:hypothetical protein
MNRRFTGVAVTRRTRRPDAPEARKRRSDCGAGVHCPRSRIGLDVSDGASSRANSTPPASAGIAEGPSGPRNRFRCRGRGWPDACSMPPALPPRALLWVRRAHGAERRGVRALVALPPACAGNRRRPQISRHAPARCRPHARARDRPRNRPRTRPCRSGAAVARPGSPPRRARGRACAGANRRRPLVSRRRGREVWPLCYRPSWVRDGSKNSMACLGTACSRKQSRHQYEPVGGREVGSAILAAAWPAPLEGAGRAPFWAPRRRRSGRLTISAVQRYAGASRERGTSGAASPIVGSLSQTPGTRLPARPSRRFEARGE